MRAFETLVVLVEASRHVQAGDFKGNSRVHRPPAKSRRGNDVLVSRLIVTDVVGFTCLGLSIDGTGDIVDMDAAEYLPGFYDSPCAAVSYRVEGAASRTIDAGDAEKMRRYAMSSPKVEPTILRL